jgi:hypothetical protein
MLGSFILDIWELKRFDQDDLPKDFSNHILHLIEFYYVKIHFCLIKFKFLPEP